MLRDLAPRLLIGGWSVAMLAIIGCSQPVEYSAQATPDAAEDAPPFAGDAGADEPIVAQTDSPSIDDDPAVSEDPSAEPPPEDPAAVAEPAPETPPWRPAQELDAETERPATEEAQRFFGNLADADESADNEPAAGSRYSDSSATAEDDDEGYLEFLQKQFGMTEEADTAGEAADTGVASDAAPDAVEPPDNEQTFEPSLVEIEITPQPETPAPQLADLAPEQTTAEPVAEEPAPQKAPKPRYADAGLGLKIGKLEMPRKKLKPKAEPELIATVEDPLPETEPTEPEPTAPAPAVVAEEFAPPSQPTTVLPWEPAPAEESTPTDSLVDLPKPEHTDSADPFDDPASRVATAPNLDEAEERAPSLDDFAKQPAEPVSPPVDTPLDEPATQPAAEPTRVAVEPLPAVPVLPYNTRHLAWLLGGKLGLAQLAGVQGATPSEVEGWSDEATRLAEQLDLQEPTPPAATGSAERRLKQLLTESAVLADGVARKHGQDHAALVEISLKTNALLVMFEDHPELAGPVARSVTSAAERAMLPGRLWRDATRRVEYAESSDELYDAVTQMHADVEAYLR